MHTVMVVEDEAKIRTLLRAYLERAGLSVVTTGSGADAINSFPAARPDLLVLDLRLPDVSGEEVAREVRRHSSVPILMLTAKAAEEDRIRGLELGADDYVTKPFSPREVVLRVEAILRRGRTAPGTGGPVSFGDGWLVLDAGRHEVLVSGRPVELTPTEWALLTTLATTAGRVYSRGELMNRTRGYEFGSERAVDSHIKNLRRKVERDPSQPEIVLTVVGAGYRLGLARDR